MSYERDEAMRQQEATEAVIRMREPRQSGPHPDPLTADFTRSLPGDKLDDSTYEAIESALDRAGAPIQDGPRWMTLAERVDALGRVVEGLNRQLTEQFELSTKLSAEAETLRSDLLDAKDDVDRLSAELAGGSSEELEGEDGHP